MTEHILTEPIVVRISELQEMVQALALNDLIVMVDVSELKLEDQTKFLQMGNLKIMQASQLEDGIVLAAKIGTGAVTENKIGTGAVTVNKLGTDAVTENKIGIGAVTVNKLGTDAVETAKIKDGNVTKLKILANSIDDTRIGHRVPIIKKRQGAASGSGWDSPGSTSRDVEEAMFQVGVRQINLGVGVAYATATINFPEGFNSNPIITFGLNQVSETEGVVVPVANNINPSSFELAVFRSKTTDTLNVNVMWQAIGPY